MKWSTQTLFTLLIVFLVLPSIAAGQETEYSLAVVPQQSAITIANNWLPLVQKLSQEAGIKIRIKTYYASIPQFESDLMNGVPDFAYMNPYHLVMAHKARGYVPLVRDKTPLVGILVAHKGGGVRSLRDLEGKNIAFPSPNAFAASLYMRALLTKKEKILFTPQYVQTHGNVYRHVTLDMAAAGGGVKDTLLAETPDIKNELTLIYETPPTVSHPLAANPRVPEAIRRKVAQAIMKLASDNANAPLFKAVEIDEPVEADYQRDYAPLARLGLEKFVVKEQ